MRFTLVYRQDLDAFRPLADQMYRDRRRQFVDELGWRLEADADGRERDRYDSENPLYLIASDDTGRHLGSTRLMATTGPTMIADEFSHLTDGVRIASPSIWEVTRFFVNDAASRRVAPGLMWAGCALALRSGVDTYVGVTGAHMVRVFTACGWKPEVIGRAESPEGEICACLWEVNPEQVDRLRRRAGLAPDTPAPHVFLPAPGGAAGAVGGPAAGRGLNDLALAA